MVRSLKLPLAFCEGVRLLCYYCMIMLFYLYYYYFLIHDLSPLFVILSLFFVPLYSLFLLDLRLQDSRFFISHKTIVETVVQKVLPL